MKKSILICALIIGSVMNLQAQELSFGAKAGVNYSTFSGVGNFAEFYAEVGFVAGGFAEYKFKNNWFALQTEALFSTVGASYANRGFNFITGGQVQEDAEVKLSYINVPILSKFHFLKGFNAFIGPQLGFLVSSKLEDDGEETDISDETNSFDFSAVVGIGYEFENGILLDARFLNGATNVIKNTGFFGFQNAVAQFTVGYKF